MPRFTGMTRRKGPAGAACEAMHVGKRRVGEAGWKRANGELSCAAKCGTAQLGPAVGQVEDEDGQAGSVLGLLVQVPTMSGVIHGGDDGWLQFAQRPRWGDAGADTAGLWWVFGVVDISKSARQALQPDIHSWSGKMEMGMLCCPVICCHR